jgi:hypothetical protein
MSSKDIDLLTAELESELPFDSSFLLNSEDPSYSDDSEDLVELKISDLRWDDE